MEERPARSAHRVAQLEHWSAPRAEVGGTEVDARGIAGVDARRGEAAGDAQADPGGADVHERGQRQEDEHGADDVELDDAEGTRAQEHADRNKDHDPPLAGEHGYRPVGTGTAPRTSATTLLALMPSSWASADRTRRCESTGSARALMSSGMA